MQPLETGKSVLEFAKRTRERYNGEFRTKEESEREHILVDNAKNLVTSGWKIENRDNPNP